MRRFVVLLCLALFLAPGRGSTQEFAKKLKTVYQAPLAKWPEARSGHGYAGPEGEFYALEATSNTWMGPGRLIPIEVPQGDFILDVSFQVVYREDCSLNITLSDSGKNYARLDLFLELTKSGLPTFSILESAVQSNFYVSNSKTHAERQALGQRFSAVDWGRPNLLTVERRGNGWWFKLNGEAVYAFKMLAFPVQQLGVGLANKSKVLLRSVVARSPR